MKRQWRERPSKGSFKAVDGSTSPPGTRTVDSPAIQANVRGCGRAEGQTEVQDMRPAATREEQEAGNRSVHMIDLAGHVSWAHSQPTACR